MYMYDMYVIGIDFYNGEIFIVKLMYSIVSGKCICIWFVFFVENWRGMDSRFVIVEKVWEVC